MPAYVTLGPDAFSDPSVAGRTVLVEEIEIFEDGAVFSFTWPENPYDFDTVSSHDCVTATPEAIARAARAYREQAEETL